MTAPPDIEAYERAQIAKAALSASSALGKKSDGSSAAVPRFRAGDSLRVQVRIREGNNERLQAFEGVCIARHNAGLGSSFTVRKRSYGEGVERIFPLYSPNIAAIEVVQRGQVRRAKLYYLRERQGKKARIAEDMTRAREDRDNALLEKSQEKNKSKDKGVAEAEEKDSQENTQENTQAKQQDK